MTQQEEKLLRDAVFFIQGLAASITKTINPRDLAEAFTDSSGNELEFDRSLARIANWSELIGKWVEKATNARMDIRFDLMALNGSIPIEGLSELGVGQDDREPNGSSSEGAPDGRRSEVS